MNPASSSAVPAGRWWLGLDLVGVVAFAAIGRASHAENVVGTVGTAAPFLAGAVLGALLVRSWREPVAWRSGVVTWVAAVVVGLALRAVFGDRPPVPFVIVTVVALGVLLLGWRLVVRTVSRLRTPRRAPVTDR